MSSLFQIVYCHSEDASKLFNKLDYVGISLIVPLFYYSCYCKFINKLMYMIVISVLGIGTIIVTMMVRFTTAAYRPVFVSHGLFGVISACHHLLVSGGHTDLMEAAMHRAFIQTGLYIPDTERFMPGRY